MAKDYSARPTELLGLASLSAWERFCLDEALHARHAHFLAGLYDKPDEDAENGSAPNLYRQIKDDPRTGKPPSDRELELIREYQEGRG